MTLLKHIQDYKKGEKKEKQKLENEFQRDSLSYLSSVAAEEFSITERDIQSLNQKIDRKVKSGDRSRNTFTGLMMGLLIGLSVFFVIFNKSKIHPSVQQWLNDSSNDSLLSLNNQVSATDTTFPVIQQNASPYPAEHFTTMHNDLRSVNYEKLDDMQPKDIQVQLPVADHVNDEQDLVLKFAPNAPVVFIHDLKITNYKLYYADKIQKSIDDGIPAQFDNKKEKDLITKLQEKAEIGFAGKQIKEATFQFSKGQYAACIHAMKPLLEINPTDVNALFYTGMSFYYLKNDDQSVLYFDKVLSDDNNIFHQEAEFYKALSLMRSDKSEEAKTLFLNIEKAKGFYSQRASDMLKK